jgi:hypothetical protein
MSLTASAASSSDVVSSEYAVENASDAFSGATYSEMESAAQRLRDGRQTVTDTLKELQGIIDDLVQDGFKTGDRRADAAPRSPSRCTLHRNRVP